METYRLKVISNEIEAIIEIEATSMIQAKININIMFNPLSYCEFEHIKK